MSRRRPRVGWRLNPFRGPLLIDLVLFWALAATLLRLLLHR